MMQHVWNRLQLMVAQGAGVLVGKYKIQVKLLDDETLDNIDRIETYGLSNLPKAGCQAFVVFPSGDRTRGFALVVADKKYQVDLQAGEVCLHDDQGQRVHLTRDGIVIHGAGKPVTITDTPKVRFETDLLEVTGEIKDRSESGGKTMSSMREVYGSHNHPDAHGGNTGMPNQGM